MGDGVEASLQPQVREPGVPRGRREGRGLAEAAGGLRVRPKPGGRSRWRPRPRLGARPGVCGSRGQWSLRNREADAANRGAEVKRPPAWAGSRMRCPPDASPMPRRPQFHHLRRERAPRPVRLGPQRHGRRLLGLLQDPASGRHRRRPRGGRPGPQARSRAQSQA